MSRGVIYIVWGKEADAVLERSVASLKRHHPELPHKVIRLKKVSDPVKGLLEKAKMLDLSPYDETLFLDADTVVLDRLDYGFEAARRTGLACCICENPYARRYRGFERGTDLVEYNTGVLFFTKQAKPVFDTWAELAPTFNSALDFIGENGKPMVMPFNDQGAFAEAMRRWDSLPFVLPQNWNFRPIWQKQWFGPLKVWHDYSPAPASLEQINAYYQRPDAIIQYHWLG